MSTRSIKQADVGGILQQSETQLHRQLNVGNTDLQVRAVASVPGLLVAEGDYETAAARLAFEKKHKLDKARGEKKRALEHLKAVEEVQALRLVDRNRKEKQLREAAHQQAEQQAANLVRRQEQRKLERSQALQLKAEHEDAKAAAQAEWAAQCRAERDRQRQQVVLAREIERQKREFHAGLDKTPRSHAKSGAALWSPVVKRSPRQPQNVLVPKKASRARILVPLPDVAAEQVLAASLPVEQVPPQFLEVEERQWSQAGGTEQQQPPPPQPMPPANGRRAGNSPRSLNPNTAAFRGAKQGGYSARPPLYVATPPEQHSAFGGWEKALKSEPSRIGASSQATASDDELAAAEEIAAGRLLRDGGSEPYVGGQFLGSRWSAARPGDSRLGGEKDMANAAAAAAAAAAVAQSAGPDAAGSVPDDPQLPAWNAQQRWTAGSARRGGGGYANNSVVQGGGNRKLIKQPSQDVLHSISNAHKTGAPATVGVSGQREGGGGGSGGGEQKAEETLWRQLQAELSLPTDQPSEPKVGASAVQGQRGPATEAQAPVATGTYLAVHLPAGQH
eukprot:SAG22_NODE_335_length_12071_cov_5.268771_12_plen_561_part_00